MSFRRFDINTGLHKQNSVTVIAAPHKVPITHSNTRTSGMLLLLNLIIFFSRFVSFYDNDMGYSPETFFVNQKAMSTESR